MRHLLWSILALAVLCAQAFAQVTAEYTKLQRQGVDAINAGRFEEGIAAFKKCLELVPEDATSAYNLGCSYSKKGEKDPAFEWLDKSALWGFGNADSANPADPSGMGGNITNVAFSQQDKDLDPLHDDPRWAKFVEKLTAARKVFDDFRANAAVYIPKSLEGAAELPVLVVLHSETSNKLAVVEGRWKNVADALGCALIAPSGKVPAKLGDPTKALHWFDAASKYTASPRTYERPVADALAAFQKEHKLAEGRLYIAGEGTGGMLAFNIALTKAGTYKGVVVVDGPVIEKLATAKAPAAVKAGLRAHFIESAAGLGKYIQADQAVSWIDEVLPKLVTGWGLEGKVEKYAPVEAGQPDPVEPLALAALQAMAKAAPVEAGAAK